MTFYPCTPIWFAHHDDPIAHYPSSCWSLPTPSLFCFHVMAISINLDSMIGSEHISSYLSFPSSITLPFPLLPFRPFLPAS